MKKRKNKDEKVFFLKKNLKNIIFINDYIITLLCPVCKKEFEQDVLKLYKRFNNRVLEESQEEYHNLTCLNTYCVRNYSSTDKSKERQKNTCLKKYGVENTLLLESSKEKSKEAILEKYGSYSNKILEGWEVYRERTGFSHNMKNPDFVKEQQKRRINTLKSKTKKEKRYTYSKRLQAHKKNGTEIFGGIKPWSNISEEEKNRRLQTYFDNLGGKRAVFSKIQIDFFEELQKKIQYDIIFGENEKPVKTPKGYYFVDGYIKELNLVIEFNGDYWHCNPEKYKKDDVVRFPKLGNVLVEEIWEKDLVRIKEIKDSLNSCNIIIIWENDWKNNRECVLEKISKQINEMEITNG